MGFRIPAVVVSPYARRSHIDHTIYGFESILKMIRYRYGLPPRTPRDLYSNNIASAFDFASKPRYDPPALPQPAESDAPAADVTRACTTAAQRCLETRTALASAQRRIRHAHTKAGKGRWKAVVGRPRGTAAAARRQARAACGTALGL